MRSFFRFTLALTGIFVLAVGVASAQPSSAATVTDLQPISFPEGVAAPDGRIAFIRNPTGGIDAINLVNGKLLWSSTEATRPLLVGRNLTAQAVVPNKPNHIRIVLLDPAHQGQLLWQSEPLALPEGVLASDGDGHGFGGRAWVQESQFYYQWDASTWYTGGTQPPPGMVLGSHRTDRVLIHLNTGRLEPLVGSTKTEPEELLPTSVAAEKSSPYFDGENQQTALFRCGSRLMALERKEDGNGQLLARKSWRLPGGEPDDYRVLLRGRITLYPHWAASSRHLLVYVQHVHGSGWWVFNLETGQTAAHNLQLDPGPRLQVLGDHLYYLASGPKAFPGEMTPRTLRCVALATRRELWRRPVVGVLSDPIHP